MKLAVILGVLQMSLGIIMKAFNSIHFGRTVEFIFEFIPQIIFLLVLFGWMDLLIVAKWLTTVDIDSSNPVMQNTTHFAPPIITSMIDMFLKFGTKPEGYNYVFPGS